MIIDMAESNMSESPVVQMEKHYRDNDTKDFRTSTQARLPSSDSSLWLDLSLCFSVLELLDFQLLWLQLSRPGPGQSNQRKRCWTFNFLGLDHFRANPRVWTGFPHPLDGNWGFLQLWLVFSSFRESN